MAEQGRMGLNRAKQDKNRAKQSMEMLDGCSQGFVGCRMR